MTSFVTVYCGNLPFTTKESDLMKLFSPFGRILNINMFTQKGCFTGVAFVDMENRETAQKAIDNLDRTSFGNRTLKVSFAQYKNQENSDKKPNPRPVIKPLKQDLPPRDPVNKQILPPRNSRGDPYGEPINPPPPLPPSSHQPKVDESAYYPPKRHEYPPKSYRYDERYLPIPPPPPLPQPSNRYDDRYTHSPPQPPPPPPQPYRYDDRYIPPPPPHRGYERRY
jgi:RNA recognition motif-containing protein